MIRWFLYIFIGVYFIFFDALSMPDLIDDSVVTLGASIEHSNAGTLAFTSVLSPVTANNLVGPIWSLLVLIDGAESFNAAAITMIRQFLTLNLLGHSAIAFVWRATPTYAYVYRQEGKRMHYCGMFVEDDPTLIIAKSIQWFFRTYTTEHNVVVCAGHGYGILSNPEKPPSMLDYTILAAGLHEAFACTKKKIDVLCLDACMMAVVDSLIALKETVHYCVASQACEALDGLHYHYLLRCLERNLSPELLVRTFVQEYGFFCTHRNPLKAYTLSALCIAKLPLVHMLFIQLKKFIQQSFTKTSFYQECFDKTGSSDILACIQSACSWSMLASSRPQYSDLKTFCTVLLGMLQANTSNLDIQEESVVIVIKKRVQEILDSLEQAILCSCASPGMHAHGLSFYNISFSRFG